MHVRIDTHAFADTCTSNAMWIVQVAGPAGYSAGDFLRFGGPLLLLILVTTVPIAAFVVWGDGPIT